MNCHQETTFRSGSIISLSAAVLAAAALVMPRDGMAVTPTITMNDEGSSATLNPYSTAGMNSWTVNGQNQLNQQWFWYQIGGGVAQPINTISSPTVNAYSGPDGINDVVVSYANAQLTLSVEYILTGGGSGSGVADMTESIMAQNISGGNLDFHFYQYSDFNLLGNGSSDSVQLFGDPGSFNYVRQWNGSTAIGEAIVSPYANRGEAAFVGTTLNELNNVSGLQLNDNTFAGPGDVTWALQWDDNLANGDMFDLTKDKSLYIQVVPEPSGLALIVLGVGAWGAARRRQTS
jgi:hypothetical protein